MGFNSEDTKGLNNLVARLLIEEQRAEGTEREIEAPVARSNKPDNVKKCYNCGKIEHMIKDCRKKDNYNRRKEGVKCFEYGKSVISRRTVSIGTKRVF